MRLLALEAVWSFFLDLRGRPNEEYLIKRPKPHDESHTIGWMSEHITGCRIVSMFMYAEAKRKPNRRASKLVNTWQRD